MAKEYDITSASGACGGCGCEFRPGEGFVAVLHDRGEAFEREDLCPSCWAQRQQQAAEAFSVWHSRLPQPDEPARPVVNEAALLEVFEKLADRPEPAKVNFRFVLALMLMRKKLLVYDGSQADEAGREVWAMHFRSDGGAVEVVRPELGAPQIAEVTAQLGALFEVRP